MNDDMITFEGEIIKETEKAWCVALAGIDDDVWLPKSQCVVTGDGVFEIPEWLVKAKGLI
jgi:hypothetical protein